MPIVKRPDGWYWGSKGPFATKQKAVQVGQAAYAAGYTEESIMQTMDEFISHLLECVRMTHILHLRTRSYAQHQALGNFYETLDDLVDSVAESYQGKYGRLIEYIDVLVDYRDSPLEYLMEVSEYVTNTRAELPQDSEIQNEIDNIQNLVNSTIYKLRFLS